MRQSRMPSVGSRLLVAVSGGADSVFLLRCLVAWGYDCVVAHCNFHLRAEESDRDERFVRDLCSVLKVSLLIEHFDTRSYASTHGVSIEMAAREQRYEWFERMRQSSGAEAIAVAHHADDNIETVLLNMLRGTGLKGLCGMEPVRGRVIRPLLCVRRDEILRSMASHGWNFVTDSTNLQPDCKRNKVRLWLLPLMEKIEPQARALLLRTIENLRDNSAFFDTYSAYGFNRTQIRQMRAALSANRTGALFTSADYTALVNRGEIQVQPRSRSRVSYRLSVEERDRRASEVFSDTVLLADADKIRLPLLLRPWQVGDVFCPYGMDGRRKKVSDLLADKKIPLTAKDEVMVVTDGEGRIVWVVGLRADHRVSVSSSTRRVVEVRLVEEDNHDSQSS